MAGVADDDYASTAGPLHQHCPEHLGLDAEHRDVGQAVSAQRRRQCDIQGDLARRRQHDPGSEADRLDTRPAIVRGFDLGRTLVL